MASKARSRKSAVTHHQAVQNTAVIAAQRPPEDPWELYHVVLALVVLAGVVASCNGLLDLLGHLHRMSELEQSGIGAAVVVALRGVTRLLHQPWARLISAIGSIFARAR